MFQNVRIISKKYLIKIQMLDNLVKGTVTLDNY